MGVANRFTGPTQDDEKLYFRGSLDIQSNRHTAPFHWLVYDRKSRVVQADIALDGPFACLPQFTPARHVLVSSAYGFSVTEVSADGNHIVSHTPYTWAGWLMSVTALLYVGWAFFWAYASIRDGGWAWIDCLLIASVPVGCIVLRTVAVQAGNLQLFYLQAYYLFALLVGGVAVSAAWLALGGMRLSIRYMPLALVSGFLMTTTRVVFGGEAIAAAVITLTLFSGFATAAVGLILRTVGVRLRNDKHRMLPGQPDCSGRLFWGNHGGCVPGYRCTAHFQTASVWTGD